MTPSQIIAADAQTNGYGLSAQDLMGLVLERRNEGWQLTRAKEALFSFHPVDNKGNIEFDVMAADPQDVPAACRVFFRMLKKAGAKSAFTTYLNPDLTDAFRRVQGYKPSFARGEEFTMKVRL